MITDILQKKIELIAFQLELSEHLQHIKDNIGLVNPKDVTMIYEVGKRYDTITLTIKSKVKKVKS